MRKQWLCAAIIERFSKEKVEGSGTLHQANNNNRRRLQSFSSDAPTQRANRSRQHDPERGGRLPDVCLGAIKKFHPVYLYYACIYDECV
jgi:hypothetical protein